jgi:hypothetical protein
MLKKRNLLFLSLLILGVLLITSCLPKPPVTEGILKGQVMVPEGTIQTKDLTDQALPDATVNIIDLSTGEIIATTTTDADGNYQVFVPAGGPYLLEAVKDGIKLQQITPPVEVGIEYDLGTADCSTTTVALIAQAMLDAEDYPDDPADINLTDIETDPDFDDVMSIVCSIIQAGQDPTSSAAIEQAVEDFLNPPAPAPTPNPTPTPLSSAKAITAFSFQGLAPAVVGIVDENAKTIALTVPNGTVVTALVATFTNSAVSVVTVGGTAQTSGATANNFTSPVAYLVTAQDGTAAIYTVTVTAEPSHVATVTSGTYTVSAGGTASETITNVPFGTAKATFLAALTKGQADQTWVDTAIADPVVSTNTLVVTAQDGTTVVTYTVTVNAELLAIGDPYGGGKVAYILQSEDPGYNASEQHGLIAATADAVTSMVWSNITTTSVGTTGTAIGTGQANTTLIVAQTGCTSGAAYYCDNLNEGSYNDWFLPSKDELNQLYLNKVAVGGFADLYYWSSSEYDATNAWLQYFLTGDQSYSTRGVVARVRAVRAF